MCGPPLYLYAVCELLLGCDLGKVPDQNSKGFVCLVGSKWPRTWVPTSKQEIEWQAFETKTSKKPHQSIEHFKKT